MATIATSAPTTPEEAAALLAAAAADGHSVRILGSQTKTGWGNVIEPCDLELRTSCLDRIVEHNAGDLTATVQGGVTLRDAQAAFARAGQMLALDPPSGQGSPTIGGIVATGDSGPLRHRYGTARDLVVGMTVALSDGTIARSGGKVIKNVAGYDLPKLFAGSFGTLGLILSVNVRLHARHERQVSALGAASTPEALAAAAGALAAAPLEFEALDVAWRGGRGGLLARCAGPEAARRAQRTARLMSQYGLESVDTVEGDESLWERQRAGQRSVAQALVRVAGRPADLAAVIVAARSSGGTLIGRAAQGTAYIEVEPAAVTRLRDALVPMAVTTVLDAPAELRAHIDPWGAPGGTMDLMRRVKRRFDPTATCNPGLFVGGI